MLAAIQLIPLVYVVICGYEYYPPKDHEMLTDPAVAELLDLNISAGVPLVGYFAGVSPVFFIWELLSYSLYSIFTLDFIISTDLLERLDEFRVLL